MRDRVGDGEDPVRAVVVALLEVVAVRGHGVRDVRDADNVTLPRARVGVQRGCFHLDRVDARVPGGFDRGRSSVATTGCSYPAWPPRSTYPCPTSALRADRACSRSPSPITSARCCSRPVSSNIEVDGVRSADAHRRRRFARRRRSRSCSRRASERALLADAAPDDAERAVDAARRALLPYHDGEGVRSARRPGSSPRGSRT